MKFDLSKYYEPTPRNIRKLADSWALFWGGLTASSLIADYHAFALICLILAYAGKAISNFSSEDK